MSQEPASSTGGERAPFVLVVTGPSGVGKGTLIRALRARVPGLELSVSATTRPPRQGELDGRDYYFLSPEEFDRRVAGGEFLEHATYAGHRYGTLQSELRRLERGQGAARGLVLEIELQGARQVRRALPEAVQVFIVPPSIAALRARLSARGSDSPEEVEKRLRVAERELGARSEFRHVVVNDRVEKAVEELEVIVSTICRPGARGAPK